LSRIRKHQSPAAQGRWHTSPRVWLVAALATAAGILHFYRDVYWRAFDDHPQESTVSFHAFGFAAANGVGLGANPLVARHIDVRESVIKPYNHWPNGFFLVLEGILRIFGRTETVGRWVAILGTLTGFTLLMVSLGRASPLVYASLPLLLLSAAARDSVGFFFIDVALNLSMGVLMLLAGHRRMFRVALAAALALNHLIAPFAAAIILLRWWERRSIRDLVIDFVVLAGGFFAVLLGLAAGLESVAAGRDELLRIFRVRSSLPAGGWAGALYGEWRDLFYFGPLGAIVMAAAWILVARARQWRTAILLPSYLLFTMLLRQYVAGHHFARLPFVFFSLLTLVVALDTLPRRIGWAVVALLAVPLSMGKQQYESNLGMQIGRAGLVRLVNDPVQAARLERCNAFHFEPDFREEGFDPFGLMGQFFFGPYVVERVRRGEPIHPCTVNWERSTVRERGR
jgi:hypothetical protein